MQTLFYSNVHHLCYYFNTYDGYVKPTIILMVFVYIRKNILCLFGYISIMFIDSAGFCIFLIDFSIVFANKIGQCLPAGAKTHGSGNWVCFN